MKYRPRKTWKEAVDNDMDDLHVETSLCGRDGRTICGPLRQPKSTYVTLAHKRKQKYFYFGCSLVRRFYCKITKLHPLTGRTDRQTDRRTDRVRRNMRPPPREEGRIISDPVDHCKWRMNSGNWNDRSSDSDSKSQIRIVCFWCRLITWV